MKELLMVLKHGLKILAFWPLFMWFHTQAALLVVMAAYRCHCRLLLPLPDIEILVSSAFSSLHSPPPRQCHWTPWL